MQQQRLDRSRLIDGLKALAAQAIVLHHFFSYGPMAQAAGSATPGFAVWVTTYGRWAVQVFLVVTGFLTARAFCGRPGLLARPWSLLAKRYIRLIWPFGVAITLAVLTAELARLWTNDPLLPERASLVQYLSHWLLLHSALNQESLSVGVWYVEIDFQLFVLTVLLLWTAHTLRWAGWGPLLIGLLTVASLVWIRSWQHWDDWAPYFYNAYGVGLLVGWLSLRESAALPWVRAVLVAVLAVLGWQLLVTLNGRLVVIALTALLLWLAGHPFGQSTGRWQLWEGRVGMAIHYLGAMSYALFLLHFPVCMLVNAAQDHFDWTTPVAGIMAMAVAWVLSMVLADVFHRTVERQGLVLSQRIH